LLYEASADLWTDADLNAYINAEIRLLPTKGIYAEELWTTSKVKNQQDYTLPTNTVKIERLEENLGTDSDPNWRDMAGWDLYAGALWLEIPPTDTRTMRAWIKKKFSTLSDNNDESDVPEEKLDIVIYGAAIRAYQALIGYMVDQKNYDAIVKPDGISMGQVRAWIAELRDQRREILREVRGIPRPRMIDLVG